MVRGRDSHRSHYPFLCSDDTVRSIEHDVRYTMNSTPICHLFRVRYPEHIAEVIAFLVGFLMVVVTGYWWYIY